MAVAWILTAMSFFMYSYFVKLPHPDVIRKDGVLHSAKPARRFHTILYSKREQASEASCTECSKLPEYSETEGQRTHAKKANWYKYYWN